MLLRVAWLSLLQPSGSPLASASTSKSPFANRLVTSGVVLGVGVFVGVAVGVGVLVGVGVGVLVAVGVAGGPKAKSSTYIVPFKPLTTIKICALVVPSGAVKLLSA